jgi:hypothetical protein
MLARRFSIVCLLVMLFGMSMAVLVAEHSRSPRAYAHGSLFTLCDTSGAVACPSAFDR